MKTELKRCLTTFDLVLIGIGSMVGSGMYVLTGEIAHSITGRLETKTYGNKPRTAKIGGISKAQNCKRGDLSGFVKLQLVAKYEKKLRGALWGLEKISQKNFENEIFEHCHSAEKCKRGGPLGFFDILTSIVLQNVEKMKGGPFVQSKSFKKVA